MVDRAAGTLAMLQLWHEACNISTHITSLALVSELAGVKHVCLPPVAFPVPLFLQAQHNN